MSVGASKLVRGRKRYCCQECGCPLPIGQLHACHSYLDEENGDGWFTYRNCLACNDLVRLVCDKTGETYMIGSLCDEFYWAFDGKHMEVPEVRAFIQRSNFWGASAGQVMMMPPEVRAYRASMLESTHG